LTTVVINVSLTNCKATHLAPKAKDLKFVLEDTSGPRTKAKDNNTTLLFMSMSEFNILYCTVLTSVCQLTVCCFFILWTLQTFSNSVTDLKMKEKQKRPTNS